MEQPNLGRQRRRWNTTRSESKKRFRYIPEELVANILTRLPVVILLRFRCVSKRWLHLISHTKGQKTEKLMYTSVPKYEEGYQISHGAIIPYVYTAVDTEKIFQEVGEYEAQISRNLNIIMGSCNGLLLIREYDNLFLWNPTIDYWRKVLSYHRLNDEDYKVVSGLCFDSHNNDYKVVLMLSHNTPSYGGQFVAVGSCKTKDWTRNIHFPYNFSSVGAGPVFNNYLHWFASPENSNGFMSPHCIIYYDTAIEGFACLPMPEPVERDGDVILGLGVLDGCFCMTRVEEPGKSEGIAQVLVMKEYGVKESWSVIFRVECVSGWAGLVPLFYTGKKKDEVLMRVYKSSLWRSVVVAYDIIKKSSVDIANLEFYEDAVVYDETMERPVDYAWHREGFCVEKFSNGGSKIWKRTTQGYWTFDRILNK